MNNNEIERRRKLWEQGFWEIPSDIDTSDFDFSWRPDIYDRPYVHEFGTQWQRTGGPRFVVPEYEGIKYRDEQFVNKLSSDKNFKILVDSNIEFDYSWHPDQTEPPFIWVFGNQHLSSTEMPTVEYHVSGSTERKYITDVSAKIIGNSNYWKVLIPVDATFDFKWAPHPYDSPYIYVWGNQWNDATTEPTIEYHVPGATDRKYMTDSVAKVSSTIENWHILIEGATIDQSWRPNPYETPYIYVWGNKWNDAATEPTIEYHVPGAIDKIFMTNMIAELPQVGENWHILIEGATIDQSWRPNPYETPYIYVWGNKWNDAATEPTIEYHVPNAIDRKYMSDMTADLIPNMTNWTVINDNDLSTFDFSWRPNPYSPDQIYQWENNGPVYTVPNAKEVVFMIRDINNDIEQTIIPKYLIETTLEELIDQHSTEVFWALNSDLNYDNFDYSWKPNELNFRHINVFGNKITKDSQTYYINGPLYTTGYREFNYINDIEFNIESDLDMFYVDRRNSISDENFEKIKQRFPKIQKIRYLNNWIATINRCLKKSKTKLCWILSSEVDYTDFKFDFYPSTWQRDMIHVFGTQWSHWGNTYLINSEKFESDTQHVKVIEHLKNINHVRTKRTKLKGYVHDVLYIDHEHSSITLDQLNNKFQDRVSVVKFQNSYLETLKNWVNNIPDYAVKPDHLVWVCSSLCNYDDFDFSWIFDPFQREQIHVFSSQLKNIKQKFGDTFLLDVNSFRDNCMETTELQNYVKKINYVTYNSVNRHLHPIIIHSEDSQVDAIMKKSNVKWPYYELLNPLSCPSTVNHMVPNVWDASQTPIMIGTTGASQILIPKQAVDIIKDEVYDYPYIMSVDPIVESKLLDIIFISNGEPAADENYKHLLQVITDKKLSNRVVRVKDVVGRIASQHAAANSSNSSWYFLVNGKLKVNSEFDFTWQPDRLQRSKHYIFMATNPVNHLEYGHQAIVANNKRLTLSTDVRGLDFTMDSPHEVVNINCGTAIYNTDSWTTWRTAFRECIKLKYYSVINDNQQNLDRLNTWLTVGDGENGQWSTGGAYDAIEYYESVNGELSELMKSYDWVMLKELYDSKYS